MTHHLRPDLAIATALREQTTRNKLNKVTTKITTNKPHPHKDPRLEDRLDKPAQDRPLIQGRLQDPRTNRDLVSITVHLNHHLRSYNRSSTAATRLTKTRRESKTREETRELEATKDPQTIRLETTETMETVMSRPSNKPRKLAPQPLDVHRLVSQPQRRDRSLLLLPQSHSKLAMTLLVSHRN